MVFADLHVHTNHSDGTQEIETVLMKAKEIGLKAIAITDHDTIHHFDEIKRLGDKVGIQIGRAHV